MNAGFKMLGVGETRSASEQKSPARVQHASIMSARLASGRAGGQASRCALSVQPLVLWRTSPEKLKRRACLGPSSYGHV